MNLRFILVSILGLLLNSSLLGGGSAGGVGLLMDSSMIVDSVDRTELVNIVHIDSLSMDLVEESPELLGIFVLSLSTDHDSGLRNAELLDLETGEYFLAFEEGN